MFRRIFLVIALLLLLSPLGWCAGKGTDFHQVDRDDTLNYIFNQKADFDEVTAESFTVDGVPITGGEIVSDSITLENGETITNVVDDTVVIASGDSSIVLSVVSPDTSNGTAAINLVGDNGTDVTDRFQIKNNANGNLTVGNDSAQAGTYVTKLTLSSAGAITTTGNVLVAGGTPLVTIGDSGDEDAGIAIEGQGTDDWHLAFDTTDDDFKIGYGTAAGTTDRITLVDTAVEVILGDATEADNSITFNGNAQDFYIGLDDNVDDLVIGLGSAVGTTPAFAIDENQVTTFSQDPIIAGGTPTLKIGDAGEEDTSVVFDGNAQDFYIGLDDTDDDLKIGLGVAVGTTPAITINEAQETTVVGKLTVGGAIIAGYEMVTTTSADPGLGTASVTKLLTAITSDATGSDPDQVSLAAGAAGQMKVIELSVDAETAGTSIEANFEGATAHALLEDARDTLILISDGTEWHIILNNGATLS